MAQFTREVFEHVILLTFNCQYLTIDCSLFSKKYLAKVFYAVL